MKKSAVILIICLFAFISCNKDEDNNPVTPVTPTQVTLAPNTKLLSDSLRNFLDTTNFNPDTLKFKTLIGSYAVNDIILSSVGEGVLRKIKSIQQKGGETLFITDSVSLAEAFTTLGFAETFEITNSMIEKIRYYEKGIRVEKTGSPNEFSLSFTNVTVYGAVTASGSIKLTLKPYLEVNINNGLKYLKFTIQPTGTLQLSLNCPVEIPLIAPKKKIIYSIHLTPKIFMIGSVPVVVSGYIPVYLGISGSAKSNLSVNVKNTTSLTLGFEYKNGLNWLQQFNNSFTFSPPVVTGECELKVFLEPEYNMKIYGTIGPVVSLTASVGASASEKLNPLSACLELNALANAKIEGKVQAQVKIFDFLLASVSSPNLIDYEYKIKEWSESIGCPPLPPPLSLPANNAFDVPKTTTVKWDTSTGAASYSLQVSNSTAFTNFIVNDTGLTATSYTLTNLGDSTEYFWRVSARNEYGNSPFSNPWKFTTVAKGAMGKPCPGIPTVLYLGKTYNTVLIGTQCWLKENLNLGNMITVKIDPKNNGVVEKYCYDNTSANCETYGGLYQWDEAMNYSSNPKGICPSGWHIPTKEEFQALFTNAFPDYNSLKEIGQGTGGGAGTNTTGFSALLAGGRRYSDSTFFNLGTRARFWTNSFPANYPQTPIYILIYDDSPGVTMTNLNKQYGFSIRCIKD
ncbi:MAG: FISUMP domain-containing protein [Ignavibacteriaceae bacterium]